MKSASFGTWAIGALTVVAALTALRLQPWSRTGPWTPGARTVVAADGTADAEADGRETLDVGFLPVTCHLTCPVTDYASRTSRVSRFVSKRFNDFPTVVEMVKSGRLHATFMIAPLAMKLREQGVPVKVVYLGHRDGSTVMVRKDLPVSRLKDLEGRTFAVPSKYSNQYLVIRKLLQDEQVDPSRIRFVELPPPDMPGAIASHAIDAYFVGEPHAARAELDGTARVLYHAKDIWPHFISCVLVVSEQIIAEKPALVKDLVRGIAESGEWADTHRVQAASLVSPFFRQDEALVRYVLTQPPDRVSYKMLVPEDRELQQIADMAATSGILQRPLDVTTLVDRQFIPKDIVPARIDPR